LQADTKGNDSWSYRDPKADVTKYNSFIIKPTIVYSDPASGWGGTKPEKRKEYAQIFTDSLKNEISKHYSVVKKKGPSVGVLQLTLLGLEPTKAAAATASRLSPLGWAVNGVKSLAGKKGSFAGSVHIAAELTDSQTGNLLVAVVRRRSPDALDPSATVSTDATVKRVANDFASAVRKFFDKENGR